MDKKTNARLSFGSQYKFPLKLMEVANDGVLLKWTDDDKGILVQEKNFEVNVMEMYPGFVQVEAFHNLRRLFRDYSFRFRVIEHSRFHGRLIEFRHPHFKKNDFDQISQVKKRLRIRKVKFQRKLKSSVISPSKLYKMKKHFLTRPRPIEIFDGAKGIKLCDNDSTDGSSWPRKSKSNLKLSFTSPSPFIVEKHQTDTGRYISPPTFHFRIPDKGIGLFSGAEIVSRVKILKSKTRENMQHNLRPQAQEKDMNELFHLYAKNELTEGQFWEVITRNANTSCSNMSWEMIKEYIDSLVYEELSPIHFKGFYYELPLSEM
ncbi:transmembrane protein 2 [Plakobranchus ocellatus]|uniref:Transmembrane protein 2 n=1 Tax=Plakobranchus ocellatus TaxID=259542 RepID=A0AAV3XWY0_9GAST|nr:transmembrane protein 2 [Plakobranchus ocellatus]